MTCYVLYVMYCIVCPFQHVFRVDTTVLQCLYFGNVNYFNGESHVIKADWLVHPVQSLQRSLPNIAAPRRGPRGTSQQPFPLLSTSADEEANAGTCRRAYVRVCGGLMVGADRPWYTGTSMILVLLAQSEI